MVMQHSSKAETSGAWLSVGSLGSPGGFADLCPVPLSRSSWPLPERQAAELAAHELRQDGLGVPHGAVVAKGRSGVSILHGHADMANLPVGYYDAVTGEVVPTNADLTTSAAERSDMSGGLELAHIALASETSLPHKLQEMLLRHFGDMPGIGLLIKNNAPPEAFEYALAHIALSGDKHVAERAREYRDRMRAFGRQMVRDLI